MVSKKVSIYNLSVILVGNYVRIDDFCILSGKIIIGSYLYILVYIVLYGGEVGIEMYDFVNILVKIIVYVVFDDFSGNILMGLIVLN